MESFQSIFSSFPIFRILLALVILAYWIHAFFIMYHLMRFGIGVKPKIYAMIFFFGSMLLFMTAVVFYNQIDLSAISFKSGWFTMPSYSPKLPNF